MLKILNFICCSFNIVIFVHGGGIYTVVAPGTLRPFFNYNVAVTVHDIEGPCKIKVGLYGSSYKISKIINMLPMSTKNIEFQIPELEMDNYKLFVKGLAGIAIENSTNLVFDYYNPLVYILTDKPIYKPGDLVQFRVLFLNQKTQPEQLKKPMKIAIKDGGSNIIQQWKNISLTHGVFTGNFQLSENPLRDWFHIEVYDGENRLKEKSFGVIKYDLPNFKVLIDLPEDVSVTDEVIRITVEAQYTFGKPVKGKATVSVKFYLSNYKDIDLFPGGETIQTTFPIDGKGEVEFNIWKELPRPELIFRTSDFPFVYEVNAFVEDELTGSKQNAPESHFTLHKRNIVINALDPPKTYHPGKRITYTVIGRKFDGTPIKDDKRPIKLNIDGLIFYSMFNISGFATFKFVLPDLGHPLSIFCNYFGIKHYLNQIAHIRANGTELPERFQLNITPQLKKEMFVEVKWTEPINFFVYIIVARGNIIKVKRIEGLNNSQSYRIKIIPTLEMMPEASIFVQYIFNNNLRFEEQNIQFKTELNDFENTLDITATEETSPGSDIEFHITTDPDSYVGLLGIDQSVWQYGLFQYDLDKGRVFADLYSYKTKTPKISGSGRYPGKISGLVSMTNAHFPWSSTDKIWGMAGPSGQEPVARERFPETWIFESFNITNQTHLSFVKTIPDTITSWVITGFSMNHKTGFALTKNPTLIKVFKPLFITLNLPYSVKQGEVISIPVLIYNYFNKTVHTEVTMDNSDNEFEFVEAINEIDVRSVQQVKNKQISVPSNSTESVSFMIRPQAVGIMTIKVTAITDLAGDSVHKKLKVEPEGVKVHKNRAIFINLSDKQEQRETIKVDIPANVVPNSEHIEFSVIGDVIGLSIKYIENLVRMPFGYGEQNMINFVPSILALKYLQTVDYKMPNLTKTCRNMLKIGFQRELNFRQEDGSYSAYGRSDGLYSSDGESEIAGSTWLTAYVVRYFQQASEFIEVDKEIIAKSLEFLVEKQTTNGNFAEFGQLLEYPQLNDASLSAFVLLAILENKQNFSKYETHIKKGITFLIRSLDETDDIYSLSITALVLQKVNHNLANEVMAKIKLLAKNENGFTWWSTDSKKQNRKRSNVFKSSDIEITSYILQAMLEKEPTDDVLPIVQWLLTQRNSNGGFTSTQDTVVGLQALIKFAEKTGFTRTCTMNIDYNCESIEDKGIITIIPDNLMVLNTHELLKNTRKVTFTAKGNGSSLVQLSYSYNTIMKSKKSFDLNVNVRKNTPRKQLIIDICTQYIPSDLDIRENQTNVMVAEVELPTGYTIGSEKLKELRDFMTILYTETKKSDTIAIIYLRRLEAYHQSCISVKATTLHEIAMQKPVPVVVYDYYNKERSATVYYEIMTSLCDICEGDDCVMGCKKTNETLAVTSGSSKAAQSTVVQDRLSLLAKSMNYFSFCCAHYFITIFTLYFHFE